MNKFTNKNNQIELNLYLEDERGSKSLVLKAIKEKNHYKIFSNNNIYYGKLTWNWFVTNFKAYDSDDQLVIEIKYDFNFKGMYGPTTMQVKIPVENSAGVYDEKGGGKGKIMNLKNKLPEYNDYYRSYVLNFIDRSIVPHEKNFQIIFDSNNIEADKKNILCQFALTEDSDFILDFKYPFNYLNAFALGTATLAEKFFVQ